MSTPRHVRLRPVDLNDPATRRAIAEWTLIVCCVALVAFAVFALLVGLGR
jgi:hypothetical protein